MSSSISARRRRYAALARASSSSPASPRPACGSPAAPLLATGAPVPAGADAVVHTDVLCCLGAKLATLRATRRALRPGGRTAFSVIYPTPGLSPAEARRAVVAGPPHCGLRGSYPRLLRSAGFVDIDEHDLTPAYLATARTKLAVADELADGMVDMLGRQEFDEMQTRRRLAVRAIADGLLRRSRFVARRPHR